MRGLEARADVVPVRQQNQYNCMTTSLCMALRALGVSDEECSPSRVNKVVGAMPMQGAAWEPLLAAANHYGMRATLTLPSTVRQLKSWTDAGKPVIIAWNPEGREWSHASLVFDVDDDLNVYVADPNIPDPDETVRVLSKSDFYSKWHEKAPQGYLVRRPACVIEREISPDGRQIMASSSSHLIDMEMEYTYSLDPSEINWQPWLWKALTYSVTRWSGPWEKARKSYSRKAAHLMDALQRGVLSAKTYSDAKLLLDRAITEALRLAASGDESAERVADGLEKSLGSWSVYRKKWDSRVKENIRRLKTAERRVERAAERVKEKREKAKAKRVAKSWSDRVAVREVSSGSRLDRTLKGQINNTLRNGGFDGRERFRTPQQAYARAVELAGGYGLEIDGTVHSHLFKNRPVILNVDMAFSNSEDLFSPISIGNSVLHIQISEVGPDSFEAIAYMS